MISRCVILLGNSVNSSFFLRLRGCGGTVSEMFLLGYHIFRTPYGRSLIAPEWPSILPGNRSTGTIGASTLRFEQCSKPLLVDDYRAYIGDYIT